jgi:hypothetical protein
MGLGWRQGRDVKGMQDRAFARHLRADPSVDRRSDATCRAGGLCRQLTQRGVVDRTNSIALPYER